MMINFLSSGLLLVPLFSSSTVELGLGFQGPNARKPPLNAVYLNLDTG